MISISKTVPSATGNTVVLSPSEYIANTQVFQSASRVAKTLTLNGGVVINNGGFIDVDRNISIACKISEAKALFLYAMYTTQTYVVVSTKQGVYEAVMSAYKDLNNEIRMTLVLSEKLSA